MADRVVDVVVFDIDDTLYLERDYVAGGFAAVGRFVRDSLGVEGFGESAWELFCHGRRGDIFDRALARLGIPPTPAVVRGLVRQYREHRPWIALLPDARRALVELRHRGASVAVLSDGPATSQAAKVAALGLHHHAQHIVLTDRYGPGYGKPHPRGFREIAERWPEHRYAYVADNPAKDFAAPHSLGWTTVRVRRPGGLHTELPDDVHVHISVTDLDGLTGVLTLPHRRVDSPNG